MTYDKHSRNRHEDYRETRPADCIGIYRPVILSSVSRQGVLAMQEFVAGRLGKEGICVSETTAVDGLYLTLVPFQSVATLTAHNRTLANPRRLQRRIETATAHLELNRPLYDVHPTGSFLRYHANKGRGIAVLAFKDGVVEGGRAAIFDAIGSQRMSSTGATIELCQVPPLNRELAAEINARLGLMAPEVSLSLGGIVYATNRQDYPCAIS